MEGEQPSGQKPFEKGLAAISLEGSADLDADVGTDWQVHYFFFWFEPGASQTLCSAPAPGCRIVRFFVHVVLLFVPRIVPRGPRNDYGRSWRPFRESFRDNHLHLSRGDWI